MPRPPDEVARAGKWNWTPTIEPFTPKKLAEVQAVSAQRPRLRPTSLADASRTCPSPATVTEGALPPIRGYGVVVADEQARFWQCATWRLPLSPGLAWCRYPTRPSPSVPTTIAVPVPEMSA